MVDHDESLEIGIAAGLDVPTAMVISQQDNKPPKPLAGKGCYWSTTIAVFAGLIVMLLIYLLR